MTASSACGGKVKYKYNLSSSASGMNEVQLSTLGPGRSTPSDKASGTNWIIGLVGKAAVVETWGEK